MIIHKFVWKKRCLDKINKVRKWMMVVREKSR